MEKIKRLKKILKQNDLDGYIVPKNDEFFSEYAAIDRLKIISNFSGSAGLAIVLKKNKPYLVIGSPGGSTIITTTMQTILNVIDHDMDIKEAVCSERFHSQWLPDVIQFEPNSLTKDVRTSLELKGHKLIPRGGYIGEANGIIIKEEGFYGGGDCRGETTASGY